MLSYAKKLKKEMLKVREAKASLKDIQIVIDDYNNQDFTKSKKTKLYNLYGGEYCEYIELLNGKRI